MAAEHERRSGGDSGSDAGGRQDLAEERTDWAKERTLLAKQRTFAAWLRTGLASVAVGFAAAQLLGELRPRWVVLGGSSLLLLAGAAIFVIGFVGYRGTFRKLRNEGVTGFSPWVIGAITAAMLIGAGLLLFAVLSPR